MSKIEKDVEALVEPIASSLGYELVEVQYIKMSNGYNLTIFIDSKNGINIDDCEKLHRAIDEPLDELNPTNDTPYILNVSSCGLDRPLKNLKDYLRGVGREVEVKFYAPIENKKSIIGVIDSTNEKELVLNIENEIIKIDISKIAAVLPIIKI